MYKQESKSRECTQSSRWDVSERILIKPTTRTCKSRLRYPPRYFRSNDDMHIYYDNECDSHQTIARIETQIWLRLIPRIASVYNTPTTPSVLGYIAAHHRAICMKTCILCMRVRPEKALLGTYVIALSERYLHMG